MQGLWSMEEIGERWTLGAEDLAWLSDADSDEAGHVLIRT